MNADPAYGLAVTQDKNGKAYWAEYHLQSVSVVVCRRCPLQAATEVLELAAVLVYTGQERAQ